MPLDGTWDDTSNIFFVRRVCPTAANKNENKNPLEKRRYSSFFFHQSWSELINYTARIYVTLYCDCGA